MRRRRVVIGALALSLATAAGAVALSTGPSGTSAARAATPSTSPTATAKVVRRDLVQTTSVSGTLTYGDALTVSTSNTSSSSSSAAGAGAGAAQSASSSSSSSSSSEIVTALPTLGAVVDRGGVLYEVNGAPGPVLMFGSRPMWRTLSTSSDDGADVAQLEENLAALGFTDNGHLTVDQSYTSATAAAVRDWEASLGRDETGTVAPSDVWFGPGPVRVSGHTAAVGDRASGAIVTVTGTSLYVHVDLDPTYSSLVKPGDQVTVALADGSTAQGVIFGLGSVATVTQSQGQGQSGSSSTTTVGLTVALEQNAGNALEESPVTVDLVASRAKNVLAIPVSALSALAEGGYAVEVVHAGGATELIGVKTGKFADGFVEVSGKIAEGDVVVVA